MDLSIKVNGNAFLGDIDALGEKQGSFLANLQKETLQYGETNKSIKLNVNTFIGDIKVNVVG
jgi:lia operon protein LiaF